MKYPYTKNKQNTFISFASLVLVYKWGGGKSQHKQEHTETNDGHVNDGGCQRINPFCSLRQCLCIAGEMAYLVLNRVLIIRTGGSFNSFGRDGWLLQPCSLLFSVVFIGSHTASFYVWQSNIHLIQIENCEWYHTYCTLYRWLWMFFLAA